MNRYGINYDTGFTPFDVSSRPNFDPAQVRAELRVIAEDLHATSVRLSGGEVDRLELAGLAAAELGLEVWFAPFPCNLGPVELLPLFVAAAEAAERVRQTGAEVVLVLGCELTLFGNGFLPGADFAGRIAALTGGYQGGEPLDPGALAKRFNGFLREAVTACRARFGGPISYAAGVWEPVDWTPFDLIGIDHYRDADNAEQYVTQLRGYRAFGKPIVITEFGCCTYQGAQDRGGMGWAVLDRESAVPRPTEPVTRDEQVQVDYFTELMDIFEAEEGVEGAFWFTFASYGLTTVPDPAADPEHDLDAAAYGVVRMCPKGVAGTAYPGLPWEPKRIFHTIAARYGARAHRA